MKGALILVSHDRYFISRMANKIWEIEDHKIREFKGTYAEWEDWKERRAKAEAEAKKSGKAEEKIIKEVKVERAEKGQKKPDNNDQKKELQKIKTVIRQLEERLVDLNSKKTALENSLATPEIYGDKQKFLKAETDYNNAVKELTDANTEYEKVFEKMMELEENG